MSKSEFEANNTGFNNKPNFKQGLFNEDKPIDFLNNIPIMEVEYIEYADIDDPSTWALIDKQGK